MTEKFESPNKAKKESPEIERDNSKLKTNLRIGTEAQKLDDKK